MSSKAQETGSNNIPDDISLQTPSDDEISRQNPGESIRKSKNKAFEKNTKINIREAKKVVKTQDLTFALVQFEKANSAVKKKKYVEAVKYYMESLSYTDQESLLLEINVRLADVSIIVMDLAETNEEEKFEYGELGVASLENAIDFILKENPNDARIISLRYKLGNLLFAIERKDDAYLQYSIVNEKPRFKPDLDSSSKQPSVLTGDETEERKIDESVTQEKSFEKWKEIYLLKYQVNGKREPFCVEAETLAQMMYNCALLAFNDKFYSAAITDLLDVYRYKISSADPVPHILEFDIIYYLGKSYLYSNNKYWAAVLLETFLRKFDRKHPIAEDYDDKSVHILLGGIYSHNSNNLALMHYFAYLSRVMGLETQNFRMVTQLSIEKFRDNGEVVNIFKRMGYLFLEEKNYYDAAHNLREVYNVLEVAEENPLELLELLQQIFICYHELDAPEEKIWVLTLLVERTERMIDVGYDLSTEDLAVHIKELGELFYGRMKDFQNSIIYLNKLLEIAKPDNPSLAKTKNKIARIHYRLGDMDKALDTCLDAEKSASSLKDDHLRVRILCMKGNIYAKKKQQMTFIETFQEALELKRSILGEDQLHAGVANILYIFGTNLYYFGNYKECVDCFLEAFDILVRKDYLNDKCIKTLQGAVRGYRQMKFYNSALTACNKILELQQKIFLEPKCSEKTSSTLELMGDICFEKGKWPDKVNAAELYRESAKVLRRYQSSDSEQVLNLYRKMASMQMYIGNNDMAMNAFKIVVKSYKVSRNGERPIVLLQALEGQGNIYFEKRRYELALQRFEKTIWLIDKFETTNSGSVQRERLQDLRIVLMLKIGRTWSRKMDYVNAVQFLSKGFRNLSTGGTKQFLVSTIACHYLYELGLACIGMGDDNLAEENFEKASMLLEHLPDLNEDGEVLKISIGKELQALKHTNCGSNVTKKGSIALSSARKFVIYWLFH